MSDILDSLFSNTWSLLQVKLPFGFSCAAALFAIAIFGIISFVIRTLLSGSPSFSSDVKGGNNLRMKIDEARRRDTH